MKPKLKYVIWLRNTLAVLLAVVLIDILVKRYYDHILTQDLPYSPIFGFSSLLFLQYYIQKEQQSKV